MAKVKVDKNLCIGCGTCVSMCPEVFELDENHKSQVKPGADMTECDLKAVATACPASAISIEN